jgi:8-oxo-dGTP pyrophosphatase MutT (NUDIX family)
MRAALRELHEETGITSCRIVASVRRVLPGSHGLLVPGSWFAVLGCSPWVLCAATACSPRVRVGACSWHGCCWHGCLPPQMPQPAWLSPLPPSAAD